MCMKSMNVYDVAFPVVRNTLVSDPFALLDRFFHDEPAFFTERRSPVVDVREEKDAYIIEAELPGLNEKDIRIELKDHVLTLSTTTSDEKKENSSSGSWIRRERRSFSFVRSFSIPDEGDEDAVEARFKDGVLEIRIGKRPETAPKVVQVKVN